jgi:hypothetical protein
MGGGGREGLVGSWEVSSGLCVCHSKRSAVRLRPHCELQRRRWIQEQVNAHAASMGLKYKCVKRSLALLPCWALSASPAPRPSPPPLSPAPTYHHVLWRECFL